MTYSILGKVSGIFPELMATRRVNVVAVGITTATNPTGHATDQ